jgi:hypothetical protein
VTIDILCGDGQKKPVFVYRSYVCAYLKYFRSTFYDSFAETKAREIDLEEIDLETFNVFLYWTYHQSVLTLDSAKQFATYMRLWIFADRFIIPKRSESYNRYTGRISISNFEEWRIQESWHTCVREILRSSRYVYNNTTKSS